MGDTKRKCDEPPVGLPLRKKKPIGLGGVGPIQLPIEASPTSVSVVTTTPTLSSRRPAQPPNPQVSSTIPPHLVSHPMRCFIEAYYQQWGRAMYKFSHTKTWLNQDRWNMVAHPGPNSKRNLTMWEGGNWLVPRTSMDLYFEKQAQDVHENNALSLNEITVNSDTATLALELDYRFPSPVAIPNAEVFDAHIHAANAVVLRYYRSEVDTMRLLVLRCAPKPKVSSGKYVVAVGLHLIYNRAVKFVDGAQISHAVAQELRLRFDLADVVDNIYIKHGNYVKDACLRPPLSSKKVDCPACSDKLQKEVASSASVPCGLCERHGSILDTNCYRLTDVRTMNNAPDPELLCDLQRNPKRLLQLATIWGLYVPHVPVIYPENEPKYTLFEIESTRAPVAVPKAAGPRTRGTVLARNSDGNMVKPRWDLNWFGLKGVKTKHNRGREVLHDTTLDKLGRALIHHVSEEYANCGLSNVLSLYNDRVARMTLTGPGCNFCMAEKLFNNSNRAIVYVVEDCNEPRVYVSCYAEHCRDKKPLLITDIPKEVLSQFMRHVKVRKPVTAIK